MCGVHTKQLSTFEYEFELNLRFVERDREREREKRTTYQYGAFQAGLSCMDYGNIDERMMKLAFMFR